MIGVGVVGYGYWGPNLARAFSEAEGTHVAAICDQSPERLQAAAKRYTHAGLTTSFEQLLARPDVDAVAIATPLATHFEMALAALLAGRHVWLEKPMVGNSGHARRLIDEAARHGLTLMIDHPYLYSSAVREIAARVRGGDLGQLHYYDSVRINLGRFRPDTSVLWDLAAHDLAILDYLTGLEPDTVSATGVRHFPGEPHDIAYLTLFYPGSLVAHVHASWIAPLKLRRTLIGGSRRMILYDDLEPSEKVKIYDRGVQIENDLRVGYRAGGMSAPHLAVRDALERGAAHFAACVCDGTAPLSDGQSGLRVVRQLEAATASLESGGRPRAVAEDAWR
jgi:predicted dehydrogenase